MAGSAPTAISTLSLHDALPICGTLPDTGASSITAPRSRTRTARSRLTPGLTVLTSTRSEEHTSELQSRVELVCRLLLEKNKIRNERKRYYTSMLRTAPISDDWC